MTDNGGFHDDDPPARREWRSYDGDWLRLASNLLLGVGLAATVAWVWMSLRSQGLLGDSLGGSLRAVSLAQRLDFAANTLDDLVQAALAIGLGLVLRHHTEASRSGPA
jgi:hypothetical protein